MRERWSSDLNMRCATSCRRVGVGQTLPVYHVGCVSPTDARYASPFARESAKTGEISCKPVAARLGGFVIASTQSGSSIPGRGMVSPFFM